MRYIWNSFCYFKDIFGMKRSWLSFREMYNLYTGFIIKIQPLQSTIIVVILRDSPLCSRSLSIRSWLPFKRSLGTFILPLRGFRCCILILGDCSMLRYYKWSLILWNMMGLLGIRFKHGFWIFWLLISRRSKRNWLITSLELINKKLVIKNYSLRSQVSKMSEQQ